MAALPEVRAALLDFQKRFARREGGAVLDGRDIGTVICPEAEAKLFVTASDEVRAERRRAELGAASFEQVLADLRARDARDAARDVAPMVAATDALLLDTTDLSIDAAVAEAVAYVKSRLPGRGLSPGPGVAISAAAATWKDRRIQPPGRKHRIWRTGCQLRQPWMISRRS